MIKLEDFKKLKQLNRIEYLLHLKRIEEKNDYNWGGSLANTFFFISGFFLLTFIGMSNLVGMDRALPFLKVLIIIVKIGIPFIITFYLIDFLFYLRGRLWKKELEQEYFKQEVKPRK